MSSRRLLTLLVFLAMALFLTGCALLRPTDIEDPDVTTVDPNHPSQIRRRMQEGAMRSAEEAHEAARKAHDASVAAAHEAAKPPQTPAP